MATRALASQQFMTWLYAKAAACGCRVKPDLRCLEESTRLYRYAAGYIQRNKVVDSRMLEQPCKEMAELLDDKAKWIMMTSR